MLISMSACGNTQKGSNEQGKEQTKEQSNNVQKENKMKPIKLTKEEVLTKVANFETSPNACKNLGDKPAIVDFYADWCGPCKMVAPILEQLQEEYGDSIQVYKVDTDAEQELAAAFGIRSIPSLLFIPKEGQPQMAMGAMSKGDFKKAIDQVLLNKK